MLEQVSEEQVNATGPGFSRVSPREVKVRAGFRRRQVSEGKCSVQQEEREKREAVEGLGRLKGLLPGCRSAGPRWCRKFADDHNKRSCSKFLARLAIERGKVPDHGLGIREVVLTFG